MKKTDIIASIMELYNSAVNAWNALDENVVYDFDHPVNMVRKCYDISSGLRKDFSHVTVYNGKVKRLECHRNSELIALENFLDWLVHYYASAEI